MKNYHYRRNECHGTVHFFSVSISLHLCGLAYAALRYVAILCLSATVLCGCDRTDEYSPLDPNEKSDSQQAMLIEKWTYADSTHCWNYYLELLFAEDMNGYLYRECIGYVDDYKDEIYSVEHRKIDFTYEFNDDNVLKLSWTDEDENEKHGMWLYFVKESVSSYNDKIIYKKLIFEHIQGDDIMKEMDTPYYEGEFGADVICRKPRP